MTNLDCIECFVRQTLGAARDLGLDEERSTALMRRTLLMAAKMDWRLPPPLMGRDIHRAIRELTGDSDPYMGQKIKATDRALALLPEMEAAVADSRDPFLTAIRISIAGNVIDLGAKLGDKIDERAAFLDAIDADVDEEAVGRLERAVLEAGDVLFLADNAGEIVFDRQLLELIGQKKVTIAVRGSPTINDATIEDARRSGIADRFRVISNGSDVPGTWLEDCSDEFVARFEAADLIVSKGQGNYETLYTMDRHIFFLFLVKCPTVAMMTGSPKGTFVIEEKER